jgi:hypothetical protein
MFLEESGSDINPVVAQQSIDEPGESDDRSLPAATGDVSSAISTPAGFNGLADFRFGGPENKVWLKESYGKSGQMPTEFSRLNFGETPVVPPAVSPQSPPRQVLEMSLSALGIGTVQPDFSSGSGTAQQAHLKDQTPTKPLPSTEILTAPGSGSGPVVGVQRETGLPGSGATTKAQLTPSVNRPAGGPPPDVIHLSHEVSSPAPATPPQKVVPVVPGALNQAVTTNPPNERLPIGPVPTPAIQLNEPAAGLGEPVAPQNNRITIPAPIAPADSAKDIKSGIVPTTPGRVGEIVGAVAPRTKRNELSSLNPFNPVDPPGTRGNSDAAKLAVPDGHRPRLEKLGLGRNTVASDAAHITTGQKASTIFPAIRPREAVVKVIGNTRATVPASEVRPGNIVKVKGESPRAADGGPVASRFPGIKPGVIRGRATIVRAGEHPDASSTPGAKSSGLRTGAESANGKLVNGVLVTRRLGGEKGDAVAAANNLKGTTARPGSERGDVAVVANNLKGTTARPGSERGDAANVNGKTVIGVAKLGVETANAKSISTVKFGDVRTNAERTQGKVISATKFAVVKVLVEKADAKTIAGNKVGSAKVAADKVVADKANGKAVVSGKGIAKVGSLKVETTTIAGRTFSGKSSAQRPEAVCPKQTAQASTEKTDAKAAKPSIKSGNSRIGEFKIDSSKSEAAVSKSNKIPGTKGGADEADAKVAGSKQSVAVEKPVSGNRTDEAGSLAPAGERADGKLVKPNSSAISRTGGEPTDDIISKGRPMDAVAKIFGIALGIDKASAPVKDNTDCNLKSRSEADRNEAKDKVGTKDKAAARADEIAARRVAGALSQSTEAIDVESDQEADDTEELRQQKDTTGKRGRREAQIDKRQWMMQIAEAGLSFGNRRAAKIDGNKESKGLLKQAGKRRRRYTVQHGDNIRSIARVQLGDERYAQLIITINRGSAGFYMLPDNKNPHLLVDQVIWLPSDAEMEVHKKHFFARGPGTGEQSFAPPISVASPRAITVPEGEMEEANLQEVEFMQGNNTEACDVTPAALSYEQKDQHEVATFLHRLRSAGSRQAITLQELDECCGDTTMMVETAVTGASTPAGDRRVYRVRLGDTLRSIALRDPVLQDQSMWPLLARINGISEVRDATTGHPTATLSRGKTIYLPSEEEVKQHRLMSRLASHANNATQCTAETDFLSTDPQGIDANASIQKLSHSCRINSLENHSGDAYVSKLEMQIAGEWVTVATYDYRHGHAFRYIHRKNGSIAAFPMDLPLEIVREMSREDFARNWTTYCIDFATVPSNAVSKSS